MAKLELDFFGIDMEKFNFSVLVDGEVVSSSKKRINVEIDTGFVEFSGKDFKFNKAGELMSGTIKSITEHNGETPYYTISGLDLAVTDLKKVALTISNADDQKLVAKLFAGNDYINTGDGDSFIYGYKGHDAMVGGTGVDWIEGGSGNDFIAGSLGGDIFWGDAGADHFIYVLAVESDASGELTMDAIMDFNSAEGDKIDIKEVSTFTFAGEKLLSGVVGELVFGFSGGMTFVSGDIDGDAVADIVIALDGDITLKASDFIL